MSSEIDSEDLSDKILAEAVQVFHLIWDNKDQDVWHWVVLIILMIAVVSITSTLVIKAIGGLIENMSKLIEVYKSSGLPIWLNKENKLKVRRRKQFCSVLDADLAYLAKAENWNDQYFTDLEAEVETEGGYYANALDKCLRRKSIGLRKESSLIKAITTSTERAMQLVGEPGSGKSVALRHLAKQFAEQGRKSNDKNATVPLYINLREMELLNREEVTADSVREFVLDNIRRGDADTSAFVKENWNDYCVRGIWIFLFDSFDEIPAVLHAETGSNIIRNYSQAVRQFLEGMGECKGILASREFKGPEALPWKKLRILPLTGEKQDELIRNSFLNETNMGMVRQHLAKSHSSIGATPLFLTLLCRYVRDENKPPNNDHDILFQHIDRLARREPEYLKRKYHLSPEELIIGAERLARLFAENENLSLAPTLDQLKYHFSDVEIPGHSLEKLISALVDSKIGRADVPNAVPGERRFAFAHRRYQEALFVRYLTKNPKIISPSSLLSDARWREYTVTLLQTREYEEFSDLLSHASYIISECANINMHTRCGEPPLPENLIYYNWLNETASPLLSLLQEGLAYRLQDVPYSLTAAIQNYLKPRWENGDSWDRSEVLRLGGLLPHDLLVKYLVETFSHGNKNERLNAFRQAAFTLKLPDKIKNVVLRMLSNHIILAKDRSELLTIEAMAARLPKDMGAEIVVSRNKRLRRNFILMRKIIPRFSIAEYPTFLVGIFSAIFNPTIVSSKGLSGNHDLQNIKIDLGLRFSFTLLLSFWLMLTSKFINEVTIFFIVSYVVYTIFLIFYLIMLSPCLVRHVGKRVNALDFIKWLSSSLISKSLFKHLSVFIVISVAVLFISHAIGYVVIRLIDNYIPELKEQIGDLSLTKYGVVGFVVGMTFVYLCLLFSVIKDFFERKKMRTQHLESLAIVRNSIQLDTSILLSAKDYSQLIFWLNNDSALLSELHSIRVFSAFTLRVLRNEQIADEDSTHVRPNCFTLDVKRNSSASVSNCKDLKSLRQILETRLLNQLL